MASPVMTQNAAGNIVSAGTSIAASGTSSPVTIDATTKFELQLQFDVLTGATAQAAGVATVKVFGVFGAGPTIDTVAITQLAITMGTGATHYIASMRLPTGKYSVTVTNSDSANAITFACTSSTIDSIA